MHMSKMFVGCIAYYPGISSSNCCMERILLSGKEVVKSFIAVHTWSI